MFHVERSTFCAEPSHRCSTWNMFPGMVNCESPASPGPEFSTGLPRSTLKFDQRYVRAELIERKGFARCLAYGLETLSTTCTGSPQIQFRTTLPTSFNLKRYGKDSRRSQSKGGRGQNYHRHQSFRLSCAGGP